MNNNNPSQRAKGNIGKNIFISYREKDSAGEAGRLVDSLKEHFVDDQIFMDIDKIEPGVDFTDAISHSLECCDVMLAIIGPRWMGDNKQMSRIKNNDDWVRLEIATALSRNIRVVPVLVDGADLPTSEELPEDLQGLLKRQAYEISNKRWRYDTDQLIDFLEKNVGMIPRRKVIPKPEKKVSLPGTLKWVFLIAGGFFILSMILYALGIGNEEDPLKNEPASIIDKNKQADPEEQVEFNNDAGDNSGTNTGNEISNTRTNNITNEVTYKNVSGTWSDANGLYYLVISQEGGQVYINSFAMDGSQSGQGSGRVDGNKVKMDINVYNVGVISLSGTVANDNINLKGTTTIAVEGVPYTEALHLIKN